MTTRRELIFAAAGDLASQFMYYDRKEDEDLPVDAIEDAVAAGEITLDEIAGAFRYALGGGI
jgi:hypothetical protein